MQRFIAQDSLFSNIVVAITIVICARSLKCVDGQCTYLVHMTSGSMEKSELHARQINTYHVIVVVRWMEN